MEDQRETLSGYIYHATVYNVKTQKMNHISIHPISVYDCCLPVFSRSYGSKKRKQFPLHGGSSTSISIEKQ